MVVGIDPGKTGAYAVLTNQGVYVGVDDLPLETYQMSKNGKLMWRLNAEAFKAGLQLSKLKSRPMTVALEWGWARPGEGVSSSFRSGRMLGSLDAIVALVCPERTHYILPKVWKKHFNLTGKPKQASLLLARRLFPDAPLNFKKDHGRAEALLIAKFTCEARP